MKFLLLALFVAVATAAPIDDDTGAVEVIVNGVPEGEALEIGHIVDIRLKEHVDDQLVASSDLLHPFTAVGLAEAAAIAAEEEAALDKPEEVLIPEPIVIPEPVLPVNPAPEPIVLPQPVLPGLPSLPEPVIIPEPVLPGVPGLPEPIILPEPVLPVLPAEPVIPIAPPEPEIIVAPEIIEEPVEELPAPAPQTPNGEIFNDGIVQVTLNAPENAGVFATVQSWFNMVVNYFSNGVQTTQQIV